MKILETLGNSINEINDQIREENIDIGIRLNEALNRLKAYRALRESNFCDDDVLAYEQARYNAIASDLMIQCNRIDDRLDAVERLANVYAEWVDRWNTVQAAQTAEDPADWWKQT